MLVIVAPGQGSQTPGFLTPWLELPGFRDRMEWLGAVAGMDLVGHGTTSDADTIKDTAVAQPLIVAAGLACLPVLLPDPGDLFRRVGATAVGVDVPGQVGRATARAVVTAGRQTQARGRGRGQQEGQSPSSSCHRVAPFVRDATSAGSPTSPPMDLSTPRMWCAPCLRRGEFGVAMVS